MSSRSEFPDLKCIWWWLRQVSGDAAYENFLRWARTPRNAAKTGAGRKDDTVPTAAEFYAEAMERKYSRASRCC